MMSADFPLPEERFSDRVENYRRFRPGYPPEIPALLGREAGLTPGSVVADIGSGTGLSTELFLKAGCRVHGVEPNREMRQAAERLLGAYPDFESVAGSAQATTLADDTVDLIMAAQAFHWFHGPEARREFSRILKPDGRVVLMWNERELEATPFLREYEQLLRRFGTDYLQVRHENIKAEALTQFFRGPFSIWSYPNGQIFNLSSLQGRLLSSSYAPAAGHPQHEAMMAGLRRIFEQHQDKGVVQLLYRTVIYIGR